jgi:hypothetical protein
MQFEGKPKIVTFFSSGAQARTEKPAALEFPARDPKIAPRHV